MKTRVSGIVSKRLSRLGISAPEVLTTIVLLVLILLTGTAVLMASLDSWTRDSEQTTANADVALAMENIVSALREARWIQVDPDGQGISYRHPVSGGNGFYAIPPATETTVHRIYRSPDISTNLISADRPLPLLRGIPLVDPATGNDLVIFSSTPGSRVLTVNLVCRRNFGRRDIVARASQKVYLRNIP